MQLTDKVVKLVLLTLCNKNFEFIWIFSSLWTTLIGIGILLCSTSYPRLPICLSRLVSLVILGNIHLVCPFNVMFELKGNNL